MFYKFAINRKCDTTDLFLSSKPIDFVQETKYLDVMLNSQVKLENSIHKPICYCETLNIVQSMSNVCCLSHIAH